MCGITGWVDFSRDLTRERDVVEAMTATMALRGPDAEGVWIDTHAALGHRRLAVIDIEGGTQPMVAQRDGKVIASLTFSGEVYNFRELRRELETRGHSFRTRSDTEVVLNAYLEWGADCARRLNGMFAFAVWDVRLQQLVMVRDRMGVKPLYYAPTPDGVLFGSEPKAIFANPGFKPAVDMDGLRQLLSREKRPGAAVWRGMREVRPGATVTVDRSGVREDVYWRLEAQPHTDDRDTTVAKIRELLEDIVSRQLIADVPLCLLLSGGLDSSAVTAIAADQHRRQGLDPVRTFAVDFVGQADRYVDGGRGGRTHDTPYVHEVAEMVGSIHTDVVLDSNQLMDPDARQAVIRARDLPIGGGDFDTSLYLLFSAIREHSTVALSGESADELFGGYAWFHNPRILESNTFPWATRGGRGLPMFDAGLAEKLDLPAYRQQCYDETLAEVPYLNDASPTERRMREVCFMALTRSVQRLLDRKDRMSMAVGLEVRVPFCDHRLVEYVFNTPWSMKTFDGREKSLLRAATADLLPQSVVERRKSPYPVTRDPLYARALREELRQLLDEPDAPVFDLVDADAVRRMVERPQRRDGTERRQRAEQLEGAERAARAARWRGMRAGGRGGIERVLTLNRWMREYEPSIVA